jgi:hypothetical protein
MAELRQRLDDKQRLAQVRENVWQLREQFMFDSHADSLITFFREVIDNR